ncbi:TonB-dependent receptor [Sphingomonas sp. PP-CC-3A-396]|uniref:TonB-dependent receptor n=1 Tax=Sphingomonas sp. PP-CC-3A-396 TaxID=2135655 RepID=UPI00105019C1|nr:TonB-dependent receptor [Sphingomonas sp. PP-CC-3A-396]TCQ10976.1 outer membrane cobalamin receptor [Sphingomonas sp. PP-CC-3A-396]
MIRFSISATAILSSSALLLPGAVLAQSDVPPRAADSPAEIVVTGRGLADAPGDRAYSIVTIGRDRIQANASNRLESVLADVAGLQQFRRSDSRSANPTSQGISLRGIGGNASSRALLIFDGVPQADPFGGWVAFPAYATGRLGRIRVTRGGGSGYQGPGALAGTVELESATPDDLTPFQGSVAYGSRDSVDAQGSAALVRGSGFATVSGAYARGDGFTPTVAESRGIVDRAAPYEQASGALRTVVGIGAKTELQMNASAFTDRRDRGSDFTANKSEGADASIRLIGRGAWGYSALAYLQTRAFASSFNSITAARTTAIQSLNQYNTPATGLGGRIEIAPPLGESITLRLGADIRDVSGKTQELYTFVNAAPTRRREAGGSTTTTGVFADGSLVAGYLTFSLGGRVDWWSIDGGYLTERPLATGAALTDLRYANRDGSETTGRAGVAYQPIEAVTLRAAGYRGWRLPTLNELYRPFRVGNDATAANALLSPERLTGVEGGVTLTPAPGVSIAATYFYNRLKNAIANVTTTNPPQVLPGVATYRVRQNLDGIRAHGFELDASYRPGPLGVQASWSHTNSKVEGSGITAALDGLRPAQTPRDQVSGTVDWRHDAAALSLTVRHVGRQFDDDQNTRVLRAATTLDAYAALPILRSLVAEFRAENFLNERVEAGISGANIVERATPRTIWVGLRYGGR